jgi:LacI family transcriptional regulator, repressor for deo operon, udp, cdd, tsx, nupC, and nupG
VQSGNFGIDGGQEAMVTLLDHRRPPTAVFAMSDEMAFGALMKLDRRSLRAGADVSVIGVDDHDVSRVLGLTTIRQRVAGQGAAAARALLARIADRNAPAVDIDSPLELVVRTTTGPRI